MKTLGLMGGMSWESTAIYYRLINEGVRNKLGDLHSAQLLLWSFDFSDIVKLQASEDWDKAGELLVNAAKQLKNAGTDGLMICTNTMHKVADMVQNEVRLPLIHIADVTAQASKNKGIKKIGLLATRFTMEQDFYKNRLLDVYDIETIIPNEQDRHIVHSIIYDELCKGNILEESKQSYLRIIHEMVSCGAEAIVLGCTEIGMLIKQVDVSVPVLDTTQLHADAAVDFLLS